MSKDEEITITLDTEKLIDKSERAAVIPLKFIAITALSFLATLITGMFIANNDNSIINGISVLCVLGIQFNLTKIVECMRGSLYKRGMLDLLEELSEEIKKSK